MLKMQLIGNLGQDAEVRELDSGMRVISFNVAHTEKWSKNGEKKEKTVWVQCNLWRGPEASIAVADYLKKSQKVYIEGAPEAQHYTNKEGTTFSNLHCRVTTVELLGKIEGSTQPAQQQQSSTPKPGDDDDLPF